MKRKHTANYMQTSNKNIKKLQNSLKGENLTGNNLFMSLDTAALENIEFPNNIFENVNISPKYGAQTHGQVLNPTG